MKMNYNAVSCEITLSNNFYAVSHVPCDYQNDVIGYGVCRFIMKSNDIRRHCVFQSWKLRVSKGKERKSRRFFYTIPAVLAELPGQWIQISGTIDPNGVTLKKVEIFSHHPCFNKR